MGTDIVRGWMIMHEGYDGESSHEKDSRVLPLKYMILINQRSGERFRLWLRDETLPMYQTEKL